MDLVVDYFKNKTNGFFIEAGAWDGEDLSNTLYLEVWINLYWEKTLAILQSELISINEFSLKKELGWTGLLVEADSSIHDSLISKNRKAYIMPSCISTSSHPDIIRFSQAGTGGHILESSMVKYKYTVVATRTWHSKKS